MQKKYLAPVLLLTVLLFGTSAALTSAEGADKKGKPQTVCPVMGDPINKKYFTDYKGNRIYFCCSSCPDDFNKDPEKYMKKIRESGVVLEKSPKSRAKKSK